MDDIFVYLIDLPPRINEMVTPCNDGYTIYIDVNLDEHERQKAYNHAMNHIKNNDFEKSDVQAIESEAHYG